MGKQGDKINQVNASDEQSGTKYDSTLGLP